MTQLLDNDIKPVSHPEEAIDQFIGEQFIEWLMNYVIHEFEHWPEVAKVKASKPKVEKIRKFMIQRFIAAEAFIGGKDGDPGFLGFAIANLSESADPEAESALAILEKKRDEELSGHGTGRTLNQDRHRELWLRLLRALGASDEEIHKSEAKEWTRNYIAELSDLYSNGEWQEVAGAFAAHERCVPQEYNVLLSMIKNSTQISDHDAEVLTWHASVDIKYVVNTSQILEKIVFDPENKKLIWQGVVREMQVKKDFWADLVKYLEI